MGNLQSKISYGLHYVFIQKVFGLLRYISWYLNSWAPYCLSKWALYLLFRQIYVILRSLWWLLSGVTVTKWRSHKPGNYEWSAHVQNIIGRFKCDPVLEPSAEFTFVTTHERFDHPQVVLQDTVSLYFITPKEAFFVECDPDVDVTLSETSSFMRIAQFNHAKKLIVLPIESFHRISKVVGPPKGQLIFINNTTRCGSTVLVQMFEKTGHCRSMSEPDAVNTIRFLSQRYPEEECLRLLESSVHLLCKPHKGRRYESFVIKTTAPGIFSTHLYQKQFPDAKKLFVYRDGIKVADSLSRASCQMPLLRTCYQISVYITLFVEFQRWWTEYFCNFPDHPRKVFPSVYSTCFYTWSQIMHKFLEYNEDGYTMAGVKYEHLVGNPLENMQIILRYCGLPEEWSKPALEALKLDSQRNSPLSMKNLNRLKSYCATFSMEEYKADVDLMCQWSNIPYDAPNDWTPEGTISVEKHQPQANGKVE